MIMAMLVGIESDVVTDGTAPSIYRYPLAEILYMKSRSKKITRQQHLKVVHGANLTSLTM